MTNARVVVIGGGVVGCSVAFHLAQRGWNDVVLLERRKLTSGTTWHAAGLVTQMRSSVGMSRLAQDSIRIMKDLEALTGLSTGFREVGQVTISTTQARTDELRRGVSFCRSAGIEAHWVEPREIVQLNDLVDPTGLYGGIYFPGDGVANPTDTTMSLARGARMAGVEIREDTSVETIGRDKRGFRVKTNRGEISAERVVNCTGMWARHVGMLTSTDLPVHPAEHFYLVTDHVPQLRPDIPVVKSPDDWVYVKEDASKLLVGFFEPGGKPWASFGIPDDSEYIRLAEDWDHVAPFLAKAAQRFPVLQDVGIQLHFNGPEGFTPDARFYLGEVPSTPGYYVAAGFNSVGLLSGPGAGKALADLIVDGASSLDLWDVDVRRVARFQVNRRYLFDRTTEILGSLYDLHWPYRQFDSARGIRRTPFHDRLARSGACFGELGGWERANWYAPSGLEPSYEYSFGRANWFAPSREEHLAVRNAVGIFDQSSFGKIEVEGKDAMQLLQEVCVADVDVPVGRIVYTQWLNTRGGIEADVTVTRISEFEFLVMTAPMLTTRNVAWLRTHAAHLRDVRIRDISSTLAMLSVMGPRSRDLLQGLTDVDLSTTAFPFGWSREIDLGYAFVRASRITYVGELGYELYMPPEFALHVYDQLIAAGFEVGLRHAGYHALNSLRLEKAYREWGHDLTDQDNPTEAGLNFAIAWDKPSGFNGRDAAIQHRNDGVKRRLVSFKLVDPEPLLLHDEPIYRNGVHVGRVTSGAYGHTVGSSVGLGYVSSDDGVDRAWVESGSYEIEVAMERVEALASLRPFYDPSGKRPRA